MSRAAHRFAHAKAITRNRTKKRKANEQQTLLVLHSSLACFCFGGLVIKSLWQQILSAAFLLPFITSVVFAQHSKKPIIVRRIHSETIRDARLEAAIRSTYGENLEDEVRYYYNKVDLNGDGRLDTLVYVFGKDTCGTSGCDALVFQSVNGEYKLVSDIGLAWNPVIVSQRKTHGWNDLILFVVGGGIQPGYYAVLRFDGHTYPENPTVKPVMPLKTRVRGIAYVAGSATLKSGFVLRSR